MMQLIPFNDLGVDSATSDPSVSDGDILVEDDDMASDYAFALLNQANEDYDIELFYDGVTPSGVTVVLFGEGSGGTQGSAQFAATADDTGRLGGFPLDAGGEFYISMLVVTNDSADTAESVDGHLTVRAGEADDDSFVNS